MQIHCLGTTGFHPSPSRHTACYYLPDWDLVLDAGTGLFRLLPLLQRDPKKSLTILISHAHLDHVVGLTFLIDLVAVTELEQVRIVGQPEKLAAVKEHLYAPELFPVQPDWEFVPLAEVPGPLQIGQVHGECFPLEHPGGALGFVLEADDRRIAYVTDTIARPNVDYAGRLAACDVLLHECYFADEYQQLAEKTGHSWLAGVTDVVRRCQPKQTWLIHVNPLAEMLGYDFALDDEQRSDLNMRYATDSTIIDC